MEIQWKRLRRRLFFTLVTFRTRPCQRVISGRVKLNEQRWALQMWNMSWQANDVGVHFNIKERYVLETCSCYEGGDLEEEEELRWGGVQADQIFEGGVWIFDLSTAGVGAPWVKGRQDSDFTQCFIVLRSASCCHGNQTTKMTQKPKLSMIS